MDYLIDLTKALFIFNVVMGFMFILTWMERKQSALMQDRIGANRADIFGLRLLGLFHPIADAIKMLTKEDFIPPSGNRLLHTLAPMMALFFALISFAVIPFGGIYQLGEYTISLQLLDINVGILYVFATMSMGIYGFVLAGWSSGNNYSLLGGLRASSQMISYEITMGATIIGLLMIYGTLSLQEMNQAQGELLWGWIPQWGIILQPLGFVLFATAVMAETKRVPFDIPEGESEIIGYFVEYSGMKFGMFYSTDFVETVLAAALIATLFFGGWQVPFLYSDMQLDHLGKEGPPGFHFPGDTVISLSEVSVMALQVGAFLVKVFFFLFIMMLIRWTLPRFRWDQLMRLGWTIMLPLSIANILVTGLLILWIES
ncbi:NADH-quinone oxidoreductase subunit H [Acidobacteria bacterium AH-259-O06]|nr:NADH-quinone oxidoreductase subunit H [Acidobacteria bacterium AH-259-O06]